MRRLRSSCRSGAARADDRSRTARPPAPHGARGGSTVRRGRRGPPPGGRSAASTASSSHCRDSNRRSGSPSWGRGDNRSAASDAGAPMNSWSSPRMHTTRNGTQRSGAIEVTVTPPRKKSGRPARCPASPRAGGACPGDRGRTGGRRRSRPGASTTSSSIRSSASNCQDGLARGPRTDRWHADRRIRRTHSHGACRPDPAQVGELGQDPDDRGQATRGPRRPRCRRRYGATSPMARSSAPRTWPHPSSRRSSAACQVLPVTVGGMPNREPVAAGRGPSAPVPSPPSRPVTPRSASSNPNRSRTGASDRKSRTGATSNRPDASSSSAARGTQHRIGRPDRLVGDPVAQEERPARRVAAGVGGRPGDRTRPRPAGRTSPGPDRRRARPPRRASGSVGRAGGGWRPGHLDLAHGPEAGVELHGAVARSTDRQAAGGRFGADVGLEPRQQRVRRAAAGAGHVDPRRCREPDASARSRPSPGRAGPTTRSSGWATATADGVVGPQPRATVPAGRPPVQERRGVEAVGLSRKRWTARWVPTASTRCEEVPAGERREAEEDECGEAASRSSAPPERVEDRRPCARAGWPNRSRSRRRRQSCGLPGQRGRRGSPASRRPIRRPPRSGPSRGGAGGTGRRGRRRPGPG